MTLFPQLAIEAIALVDRLQCYLRIKPFEDSSSQPKFYPCPQMVYDLMLDQVESLSRRILHVAEPVFSSGGQQDIFVLPLHDNRRAWGIASRFEQEMDWSEAPYNLQSYLRPPLHRFCPICCKTDHDCRLRKCSGCMYVYYCSEEHQHQHWSQEHRHDCKKSQDCALM